MFSTHVKVTGELDDCDCDVETIDAFNDRLYHKLQTLLESDYFRFYKVTWSNLSIWVAHKLMRMWTSLSLYGLLLQVTLNKVCPFWTSESHCGLRDCAVQPCSPVSCSSSRFNSVELLATGFETVSSEFTEWSARRCQSDLPQQGEFSCLCWRQSWNSIFTFDSILILQPWKSNNE